MDSTISRDDVLKYIWPISRLILAILVILYTGKHYAEIINNTKRRSSLVLQVGIQTAIISSFLTFAMLEVQFSTIGSSSSGSNTNIEVDFNVDNISRQEEEYSNNNNVNLSTVALYVLAINAALVGLAFGILVPSISNGASFGIGLVLFVGSIVSSISSLPTLYFAIVAPIVAILFSILSLRLNQIILLSWNAVIINGGIVSSLIVRSVFIRIKHVARGDTDLTTTSFSPHDNEEEGLLSFLSSEENSIPLTLVWIASSILIASSIIYHNNGNLHFLNLLLIIQRNNNGYSQWEKEVNDITGKNNAASLKNNYIPPYMNVGNSAADSSSLLDTYNMFDPANLPPRLAEYANMVYSACEDLGNFFGFQDSSVRNQAEHLLILLSNNRRYMSSHILPPSVQPPSPIHALHAKVFSNYMKWCRSMSMPPYFSRMNTSSAHGGIMAAPPAVASRVVDLVLFFCIWGEAANIRHMPECLWFLYHKMMEEYTKSEGYYTQSRSLYDGYFLDHVVSPIYNIVASSMKDSKSDHQDKRNYDDFNEFFWSIDCLKYRYDSSSSIEDGNIGEKVGGEGRDVESFHSSTSSRGGGGGELNARYSIADAMSVAPKTFLEKRSWLRGILALYRVVEWHIVTFYLLAVIAFSRELVWGWVYSLQVASGVFWVFNALHLVWALLEVWSTYPGIQMTNTAVFGSAFTVATRFLFLVYQTLYIMWTFTTPEGETVSHLGISGNSIFWWWQYIWLSLLCMVPYFIDASLQIYPVLSTSLYTSQNDYVQAFLEICFPLSRLYVGKELHESFKHTAVYMLYWGTLIIWKLSFSYVFEVYTMVLPSLQITDDYFNYPGQSFLKMILLLLMRWLPQFIVYNIDLSIWYAAWQAFAGTLVGLSENVGYIRSIDDIRNNFGSTPENFCRKMLSPDAGSRRGSSSSFLGGSMASFASMASAGGSHTDANNTERTALLRPGDPFVLQSYVNRLLDVRIQKWVMFSAVWNEIIDSFRQEDIISDRESDNLKFSTFVGFSQAIYLPVFQTAGVMENVLLELERPPEEYKTPKTGVITDDGFFKPISEHITMYTTVSEVWDLGTFLFLQMLGTFHRDDIVEIIRAILRWTENGDLTRCMKLESMRSSVNHFVALVKILEKGIDKRQPSATPRLNTKKSNESSGKAAPPKTGMRRAISASSLGSLETEAKQPSDPSSLNRRAEMPKTVIDALRDQVRDKLRNMAHALKSLFKDVATNEETRDVVDRITFLLSMENGFLWDDEYASDQLDNMTRNPTFRGVLKKLYGLLACHPDDVEPVSKEVRRRLTFFTNTLFMDMPDAPSLHDMFSWNVLTPFYSEDVTYTKDGLEKRSDALGVSTLLYLQTLYRADWNNFIERRDIRDEERIWSSKHSEETRRWASIRAQTLSRTVNGMMYYEKALRLLANLERLDDDTTNDLLGEKFGYVVACQVYGNMKRNQDPKADDIENLMHRFPHLRVAYIDSIRLNRAGASVFYSCLVKSDGQGNIKEIYRVRLPGNPIIGEGKPENQNHAMIFTRSEFLQTIDMNQEGYFEEALKMRNCLQEFAKREGPLPTTILGLREHIFTGSVSSLANYMALQETSFVTLGQRVLTRPLCIRLHYGHPDLFDKLFVITRGGISKSSKGINLSEDIFAGYNCVIRGGSVGFKEYLQVGKGRDVGMSQIYKFEAKLSQGAAEQSLSRDVYRLCHRLDFSRLMSFFYGGIGHYFANVLTILTVYVVVYLMVVLAIFDLEQIGERKITPMGTIQMFLGGLGLLQTIPLFATLGVERGWWSSVREIFQVFITGGPFHFMFHIQTKANYMAQTILVGGARYRATGRGFVTQHTPFDEQYRFFASSHLYLGAELSAGLILMAIYTDAGQYVGRTWSLWLAAISFLASPFWFNPLSFDWSVTVTDYDKWLRWIRGRTGGASKSWSIWWNDENSFYKTMPIPSKMLFLIKSMLYLFMAEGIRRSNLFKSDPTLLNPLVTSGHALIVVLVLVILSQIFSANERSMPYPVRRTLGILICIGLIAGVMIVFVEDTNFIRYSIAAYYGIGAICQLGLLAGLKAVKPFYLVHDIVCGHIIFIPLLIMAALQLPNYIQTWLLYHNALSTDVVVGDILRYARKTQERGNTDEIEELTAQVSELKKIVQKQEEMLADPTIATRAATPSTTEANTPNATSSSSGVDGKSQQPMLNASSGGVADRRGQYARATSLSGLDVWGGMAFGGGNNASSQQDPGVYSDVQQMLASSTDDDFLFTQPERIPPR